MIEKPNTCGVTSASTETDKEPPFANVLALVVDNVNSKDRVLLSPRFTVSSAVFTSPLKSTINLIDTPLGIKPADGRSTSTDT